MEIFCKLIFIWFFFYTKTKCILIKNTNLSQWLPIPVYIMDLGACITKKLSKLIYGIMWQKQHKVATCINCAKEKFPSLIKYKQHANDIETK